MVWNVLNTPAGITVIAGIFLWLMNRLYTAKPAWMAFEGTIISAIKFAEKQISDETPNKGLARLDMALKYVINVYTKIKGKPSDRTVTNLKEGIQIIHNELDQKGILS
jgi:hypothetical protein